MADLRRLAAVPVDLSVEIGRARMSVGETLELREGSVVTLDRMAGEPVVAAEQRYGLLLALLALQ